MVPGQGDLICRSVRGIILFVSAPSPRPPPNPREKGGGGKRRRPWRFSRVSRCFGALPRFSSSFITPTRTSFPTSFLARLSDGAYNIYLGHSFLPGLLGALCGPPAGPFRPHTLPARDDPPADRRVHGVFHPCGRRDDNARGGTRGEASRTKKEMTIRGGEGQGGKRPGPTRGSARKQVGDAEGAAAYSAVVKATAYPDPPL